MTSFENFQSYQETDLTRMETGTAVETLDQRMVMETEMETVR